MKMKNCFLLFLLPILLHTSCKKDNHTEEPSEVSLKIVLQHTIDEKQLEFDNIVYTNAFGNNYSVSRLQYFISGFKLTQADGTVISIGEAHYVDATIEATHTYRPEQKIPKGDYVSFSFVFGLDAETNINGQFPNPPESNMEWPPTLGGGYHYMKLEGKIEEEESTNNYQAHSGPTNGNQNFILVNFVDASFSASSNDLTINVSMNINNWWENPNTIDLNTMTMMMGNQQLQQNLKENGGDVFGIEVVNGMPNGK
jgi:hypothetical protein